MQHFNITILFLILFDRHQHLVYCRLLYRYVKQKYSHLKSSEIEQKYAKVMQIRKELDFIRDNKRTVLNQTPQNAHSALVELYNLY